MTIRLTDGPEWRGEWDKHGRPADLNTYLQSFALEDHVLVDERIDPDQPSDLVRHAKQEAGRLAELGRPIQNSCILAVLLHIAGLTHLLPKVFYSNSVTDDGWTWVVTLRIPRPANAPSTATYRFLRVGHRLKDDLITIASTWDARDDLFHTGRLALDISDGGWFYPRYSVPGAHDHPDERADRKERTGDTSCRTTGEDPAPQDPTKTPTTRPAKEQNKCARARLRDRMARRAA